MWLGFWSLVSDSYCSVNWLLGRFQPCVSCLLPYSCFGCAWRHSKEVLIGYVKLFAELELLGDVNKYEEDETNSVNGDIFASMGSVVIHSIKQSRN